MKRGHISRRRFALMAGTAGAVPVGLVPLGIVLPGAAAAEPLTAGAVVRRIQTALGGDWPSAGPDGFKAGNPSTVVRGIATTAMATMDVLKQAVKANANLILTYEPTFYSRTDVAVESPPGRGGAAGGNDPVVKAKREFIEKNGLVVFRLRDHWQARKENDMVTGLASALGWSSHAVKSQADGNGLYEIPPATAAATVALIRSKLNLRAGIGANSAIYSFIDALLFRLPMAQNASGLVSIFTTGEKRALVTTGRVVSEDPGMRACADWLKTIVKELPAKWIGVGDPYWRPA